MCLINNYLVDNKDTAGLGLFAVTVFVDLENFVKYEKLVEDAEC
jgi:hypothetical protein